MSFARHDLEREPALMSPLALLALSATAGGVLGGMAPLAQMRLVLARKSSEGISVGYWAVVVLGISLWLAYGIASRDAALIAANGVALVVGSSMLGVVLWHRPRRDVAAGLAQDDRPDARADVRPAEAARVPVQA